ncbi:MAG: hypothetical protein ICV72_12060 [Aldersonia sp.]|nr:hypothetical protein [Aldersonia sp.]
MDTINELPAHVLLVHFVVVLIPVTVVLEVACAVWRSLRNLLWWATVLLSGGLIVLTWLTAEAGEWLQERLGGGGPAVQTHAELGDTAIWFVVALFVVSLGIAAVYLRERRAGSATALVAVVAALAIGVGIANGVQIYRIGDSGAKAVWGETL